MINIRLIPSGLRPALNNWRSVPGPMSKRMGTLSINKTMEGEALSLRGKPVPEPNRINSIIKPPFEEDDIRTDLIARVQFAGKPPGDQKYIDRIKLFSQDFASKKQWTLR